jgi:hypothetical protein
MQRNDALRPPNSPDSGQGAPPRHPHILLCARYATTSASWWLHLVEDFKRQRGTLQASDQTWLGDHLTALDRFEDGA